jgi:hypothetical protein
MIEGSHLSTRQYIRLLKAWVELIGLEPAAYGTHSLRRTKVAMLYRKPISLASNATQQERQPAYLLASSSRRLPVEWRSASARTSASVCCFMDYKSPKSLISAMGRFRPEWVDS